MGSARWESVLSRPAFSELLLTRKYADIAAQAVAIEARTNLLCIYGGFLDKIPMGSAINRGLTFRMAQTPVQHYLPKLLKLVEEGKIDPSFVITHTAPLEDGPASTRPSGTRKTAASKLFSSLA